MTVNDGFDILISLVAGAVAGGFFFGGLWYTVQSLPAARYPAPLALGSFVVRTAVTLLIFYLASGGRWERLVACLVGFILVRAYMLRRLRPQQGAPGSLVSGDRYGNKP